MGVNDVVDFSWDVLLPVILLSDNFFEVLRAVLLGHVGHAHFHLSAFLFELELVNLLFILVFYWWNKFYRFRVLLGQHFIRLVFFFHRVLLEAFDDCGFGHEWGDFIFEIRLSRICEWVHFLDASLDYVKTTMYSCRRVAIISPEATVDISISI